MQSERTEIPEIELVARTIEGDASAYDDLYERYLDQIYRYVYYSVSDRFEAKDLTENVFLKAWETLPRYRNKGLPFRAWLYRITHNAVVDRHRMKKPAVSLEQVQDLRDADPTPEGTVEAGEKMEVVAAGLAQLKPRLRQVVLCRFISELSHAETAEIMGISEGHVHVLQHRALKQIQRFVTDSGV